VWFCYCRAVSPSSSRNNQITRIRARKPLQIEIREAILDEFILSGRLNPGDRMPSEAELCELFGASRVTIRTALQGLKDAGYIRIVRGSGSWVMPRPESIRSGLDRLVSFDTFARQAGKPIDTGDLEITRLEPGADLTDVFDDAVGFTRVSRTKLIDGAVVAWIVDIVPDHVLTAAQVEEGFAGSVLDLLVEHDQVAYADCTITPVVASGPLRKRFGGATPLLQLSELTRDTSGAIVNRSEAWLSPDAFSFQLRRRREG